MTFFIYKYILISSRTTNHTHEGRNKMTKMEIARELATEMARIRAEVGIEVNIEHLAKVLAKGMMASELETALNGMRSHR